MRRYLAVWLLTWCFTGAWAEHHWQYPDALENFQLVTRAAYPQPDLGVVGRYSGSGAQRQLLDLFAYPVPGAWRALEPGLVLKSHFSELLREIEAMGGALPGRSVEVLEQGAETLPGDAMMRWARLRDRRGDQTYDGLLLLTRLGDDFIKLRASQLQPLPLEQARNAMVQWLAAQNADAASVSASSDASTDR